MDTFPSDLAHLLDALGVGRPGPDGKVWSRAAFAAAINVDPRALTPSWAKTRAAEDLRLACSWALAVIGGDVPCGWQTAGTIRDLAVSILRARASWRGESVALAQLPEKLAEWGIPSAESVAEVLRERHGARLEAALWARGWAGVLEVVREVLA